MIEPAEGWGDARDASGHRSRRSHYFVPRAAAGDELRRSLCTKAHRLDDDARLGPIAVEPRSAPKCQACLKELDRQAERAALLVRIAAGAVRFRRGGPSWTYVTDAPGAPDARVTAAVTRVIEAGLAERGIVRLGLGRVSLTPAGYRAMNDDGTTDGT